MMLQLRSYQDTYREACLRLLHSNVPHFFAPSEEEDFHTFLTRDADDDYFVVTDSSERHLGCGGVYLRGGSAGFCWGMVERGQHRQGIGTFLLVARLEHLRRTYPHINTVRLDTSQHSQGFFARFGFVITQVTPNAYAPGLDRFDMVLQLGALTDARLT